MNFDAATESWLDLTGLMPPLPKDVTTRILGTRPAQDGPASGQHTYLPHLVSEDEFRTDILPQLQGRVSNEMLKFIESRVEATFRLRATLRRLRPAIESIVGAGNFSALWLDRAAFSADSMEHRALVTEAVIHVYSADALGKLVALLYTNDVPMIPYGEGGGYNMGVTPMAPAVTISLRGIDHISPLRPSRRTPGAFEVTVGAGVPFKDLQAYLERRGYLLRCDPNTPRAATGGIVATGSNGGRKIFEIVLEGRAVTAHGAAVRFAPDAFEEQAISDEPFLMAKKFFGVPQAELGAFVTRSQASLSKRQSAAISPDCRAITVPLIGPKARVNMAAQRMQNAAAQGARPDPSADPLALDTPLPMSCFVGAEGCSGFIYEVTLECESPLAWIQGCRLHFSDVAAAMTATRAIKKRPRDATEKQPVFFEVITGESIRAFLLEDFPLVFDGKDEAVLFVGVEGRSEEAVVSSLQDTLADARQSLAHNQAEGSLRKVYLTPPENQKSHGRPAFSAMIRPREELPKKLRTKCKTDMEIRTEYLADVLHLVTHASVPKSEHFQKQDVMFGHLTPHKTAIIHWNIGGFDLYNEESAHAAWEYLERVIGQAQSLAPKEDPHPSAVFSGEHGIAGKAPFLWLNHIDPDEFERMCRVKDALDPKSLFNPETLFLRTSVARSLRARLIGFGSKKIAAIADELKSRPQKQKTVDPVESALEFATAEALRCTRCTSCKICPVIDAEHDLRRENPKRARESVLPSKRNLIMFLEWVAAVRHSTSSNPKAEAMTGAIESMFRESAKLLAKCFYCRKCDKTCPVDINIHPMVKAFQTIGKVTHRSPLVLRFLYERLMGEDRFKDTTYRIAAVLMAAGAPVLAWMRRLRFIPDWAKTYLSPPRFAFQAYEPEHHGKRLAPSDNFVLVSPSRVPDKVDPIDVGDPSLVHVFIRYRGCMDTYANPAASETTDTFFRTVLGAQFVDLEKKMCCGFPFEADGLAERAAHSRFLSLVEIYRCVARILATTRPALSTESGLTMLASPDPGAFKPPQLRFTVFSNCPTCTEAIREMRDMLADPVTQTRLRLAARLPQAFSFETSEARFDVLDTAEVALKLLDNRGAPGPASMGRAGATPLALRPPQPAARHVGLKVPCHNTPAATAAQMALLGKYYQRVSAYDRCCGLSGTGRLKHPKIGTKIAERLFEQIAEATPDSVVSGCPSCRDGVSMQRDILAARKDPVAEFNVSGIFEQIVRDHGMTSGR